MMPTFAAIAKAPTPQYIDGINILPLFYGRSVDTDHRLLYWEFPGKQRAARRGDWKAVAIHPNAPLELYNIKNDLTEQHNLASKYPKIVEEFDKAMKKEHVPSPNWPLAGEFDQK
jgi:arylsulfatase A-like enzyme